MTNISEKLQTLNGIKTDLKEALITKGATIEDSTPFTEYASILNNIPVGGDESVQKDSLKRVMKENASVCKTNYTFFRTSTNGFIDTDNNYNGASGSLLLLPEFPLLSEVNTWEFRTTFTYKAGGNSNERILGYYNTNSQGGPELYKDSSNGFRLRIPLVGAGVVQTSTQFFIPEVDITYNVKAGFSGSEYFLEFKRSEDLEYTRDVIQETKKCNSLTPFQLELLNSRGIGSYFSKSIMNLNETSFYINGELYWQPNSAVINL